MKAITIKQPWADMIVDGDKTIETRTWPTKFRGPLLIHAAAKPADQGTPGAIVGIAEMIDCRRMLKRDEGAAACEWVKGLYAWELGTIFKFNMPVKCKGSLSMWELPEDLFATVVMELMYGEKTHK